MFDDTRDGCGGVRPPPSDIVAEMRGFEIDHEPDGWPAVRMRQVSALCDEVEKLRQIVAALASPVGWRLVPVRPTTAMLEAAQTAWLNDPARKTSTIYRAMLDAAPAHNAGSNGPSGEEQTNEGTATIAANGHVDRNVGRRVVCAAMRNGGYDVICSPRHWDAIAHVQAALSRMDWRKAEQGFVDQHGEFLTRTEAWAVAEAAGQISRRVGGDAKDGGTLYSENLY